MARVYAAVLQIFPTRQSCDRPRPISRRVCRAQLKSGTSVSHLQLPDIAHSLKRRAWIPVFGAGWPRWHGGEHGGLKSGLDIRNKADASASHECARFLLVQFIFISLLVTAPVIVGSDRNHQDPSRVLSSPGRRVKAVCQRVSCSARPLLSPS